MTTTGEKIFRQNAVGVLRDMNMRHLDLAHGAAVDIVRWCLLVKGRPTHHRQRFLEQESPAVLAYLEKLASSGDAAGWRTLEERVRLRAEILRDGDMQPYARPWLAAIWHTLPELAGIGQYILDRLAEKQGLSPPVMPVSSETTGGGGSGDGDKGSAGKAGSAGTTAKPRPASRLSLPVVQVTPTPAEEKALDLGEDASDAEATNDATPSGPGPCTSSP